MSKDSKKTTQEVKAVDAEGLHNVAVKNIYDALSGNEESLERAALAMKFLNYESRGESLQHGRSKLAFMMVRSLSDPGMLKKYVASTEPQISRLTA